MSRVAELIDLIVQGKNAEASEVLNSELLSRSYEKIGEIKPQIAADYFAPVVDMPADGSELNYEHPDSQEEDQADETN